MRDFSFENDEWVIDFKIIVTYLIIINYFCLFFVKGRSQVDAEDPNFLHEQIQLIKKSRKALEYSREKDNKFTPLRHLINLFSILLLLIGLGHIISSGKIRSSVNIFQN